LTLIPEFNCDEIFSILNIFQSCFFSNIKNKNCENFIKMNLNSQIFNKINLDMRYRYKIIHKIILSHLPVVDSGTNLDFYFMKYLECFETDIQQEEVNYYFINLCTILYNSLLYNYSNHKIIKTMCEKIFYLLKFFSINETRFIRRIMLIIENLKIVENVVYKNKELNPQFKKIEENFFLFTNPSISKEPKQKIWWDKNSFSMNKYTSSMIREILQNKNSEIIITFLPQFKNAYYADFAIEDNKNNKNSETDKKYIEFLGPYHLNHFTDDIYNFSQLNKKYQRKLVIYKINEKDLIYIPFEKVIENINNI
jgi:hypothetical protein